MMYTKKRILFFLFFSLVTSFCLQGQTTTISWGKKDAFYMEQQIGANYSMNENTRFTKFWNSAGWSIAFLTGKEFTPLLGWRASLGYSLNRGQNTWKSKLSSNSVSFYDLELFADGTLDLTDWWFPNRKQQAFNLKGFLGIGYLQTFGFRDQELAIYADYSTEPTPVFGFRGGLSAGYKLHHNLALAIDASLTCMQDKFNGVVNKRPLDGRLNFNIGLIWHLHRKETATPVVPVEIQPLPPIKEEIKKIEITPLMAYITPQVELVKKRVAEGKAYIDFPVNEIAIYPTYRKNPTELMVIRKTIDQVIIDSTTTITSITIHGYASPEGFYQNNARLAKGRSEALRKYLRELYYLSDTIFTVESTPEDWEGLRRYVTGSDMADKEMMLDIIDSSLAPDPKDKKLKQLNGGRPYAFLLKEVYPALRHSDYTVHYTVRSFDVEEGKKLIYTRPDLLSLNEMFYIARSYSEGSEEYKKVFQIAVRQYPDDPVANLNAASIALENKQLVHAKYYLTKAGDSPEAIHARGVLAAIEGDYEQAKHLLMQSSAKGVKESDKVLEQLRGM